MIGAGTARAIARQAVPVVGAAAVCGLLTTPGWAQAPAPAGSWTRGTTLNVFAGAAVDEARTAVAGGGAFGWEVTARFGVEGSGAWLARGPGADGFAADLTALYALTPPRRAVPFVKGGVGLYRASFDPERSPMPDFYRNRLEPNAVFNRHAIFTDTTLVVGGGVTAWLSRTISLRPEVDVKLILHDGEVHPLAIAAVRVGYHFVEYPIESRRR